MEATAAPQLALLQAAPEWQAIEFISDLHLQPGEPATFAAWQRYMAQTTADAVFILGDLFEVWVGDDAADMPGFAADCAGVLEAAAHRRPVFFMHGNRDFLVGPGLMRRTGLSLLDDPTVLAFAGDRWLLTHGDSLCLSDTEYLQFRDQVRSSEWRRQFLARPLHERNAIGRQMREASQARKHGASGYADVDSEAVDAWLDAAGASVMIHGHTHRPGDHWLPRRRRRMVLSDWDAGATPPRLEALRVSPGGPQRLRLAA